MPGGERAERTKRLAAAATALPPRRWFLDQLDAAAGRDRSGTRREPGAVRRPEPGRASRGCRCPVRSAGRDRPGHRGQAVGHPGRSRHA